MKKKTMLGALLLALVLCLALPPVTARALEAAAGEPAAPIENGQEETFTAREGDAVFNNGGVVFNNGGTVYNNAGTVYNNAGTVYNNAGTVYANGGTVYNNAGTVYNNGATLTDNGSAPAADSGAAPAEAPAPSEEPAPEETPVPSEEPEPEESPEPGFQQVAFAADYSALVELEGLEPAPDGTGWLLPEGESCVLRPLEGYTIEACEAEGGKADAQADGSYSLRVSGASAQVTLSVRTGDPVLSLQPGTFTEHQYLELTGPEGAAIYFTDDGSEPEPGQGRYTGPIALREGTCIRAIAQAEGALPSREVRGDYAFVSVTGPQFEAAEEGYKPQTQAIVVKNAGTVDAKVQKLSLSGEDAGSFYLSHSSGRTVPAGAAMEQYWTVTPVKGLKAGTYTALVTLTLDGGEAVELDVSFTVEAKTE